MQGKRNLVITFTKQRRSTRALQYVATLDDEKRLKALHDIDKNSQNRQCSLCRRRPCLCPASESEAPSRAVPRMTMEWHGIGEPTSLRLPTAAVVAAGCCRLARPGARRKSRDRKVRNSGCQGSAGITHRLLSCYSAKQQNGLLPDHE